MTQAYVLYFFFFFNDTATTEIYTLSLHDALPICHEFVISRSSVRTRLPARFRLRWTRRVRWSVADHSLPGLTRPYALLCFVFEVRGCNWSTIRLRVAWSAALRLLRQAPNIRLTASAPLSLAFIPAGVIVSR